MAKRNFENSGAGHNSKKARRPDDLAMKFLLPNVVVGALLSRKAANLKRIRDQVCHNREFLLKLSGKDQFYPGTSEERMIALVGPPPMIHKACCMLQDQIIDDPFLVTDESGENENGPRQGQMRFAVSDRAASKIIGSKGAVVKDISSHFNISITITPMKDVVVPDERVVTILGPSRNVFDALEPLIYQMSQQNVHIKPDFDYYFTKVKEISDEKEETSEKADEDAGADVKVEEDKVEETKEVEGEQAKEEPVKEEPVLTEEPAKVEEDTKEDTKVEITAKDESAEEKDKPDASVKTESEEKETVEEEKTEDTKEETKEGEEDKKEGEEDKKDEELKPKRQIKDPRKDGRWFWQTDRNHRPKWVWVENSKQGQQQGGYSRGGGRGGRGGRMQRH